MEIDAVLNPAEIALLPARDLSGTTCVVFDILRATSTMITGLASGVEAIWPAATIEEARDLHRQMPHALLGGERHGDRIEGFDVGNNPLEYEALAGRTVITTTTNGTVALRACENAGRVLVGALLNLDALRKAILASPPAKLLLVCAGTFETFALEDAIAAGELCALFPHATLTDAARTCLATARAFSSPLCGLQAARNGRALIKRGWGSQVEWCAVVSRFDAVGVMSQRVIRRL